MAFRLINTLTHELHTFEGVNIPDYAILSHTWSHGNEISYLEMTAVRLQPSHPARQKSGYLKIRKACEASRNAGLRYIWIDTCCIDKSSSADLSEAINSMFRWYQDAKVCFAYLEDLPPQCNIAECLPRCKWFTRGWCLQELIAPQDVVFYDSTWEVVGSKSEGYVRSIVSRITRIGENVLMDPSLLPKMSVARKMSWAAYRETTRVEDKAYCLLGIFGVNMPLIYGEGPRAFIRLQKEIINESNDLSIFAWGYPDTTTFQRPEKESSFPTKNNIFRDQSEESEENDESDGEDVRGKKDKREENGERKEIDKRENNNEREEKDEGEPNNEKEAEDKREDGENSEDSEKSTREFDNSDLPDMAFLPSLLAESPYDFASCSNLALLFEGSLRNIAFSISNNGLFLSRMKLLIDFENGCYHLRLPCCDTTSTRFRLFLALKKVGPGMYARLRSCQWIGERCWSGIEDGYVITKLTPEMRVPIRNSRVGSVELESPQWSRRALYNSFLEVYPRDVWDAATRAFLKNDHYAYNGYVKIRNRLLPDPSSQGFQDFYLTWQGHFIKATEDTGSGRETLRIRLYWEKNWRGYPPSSDDRRGFNRFGIFHDVYNTGAFYGPEEDAIKSSVGSITAKASKFEDFRGARYRISLSVLALSATPQPLYQS